jgi:hypothetical protein
VVRVTVGKASGGRKRTAGRMFENGPTEGQAIAAAAIDANRLA